jgi:G6PDH family F420-dependent oxidoreductase
VTEFGYALSAEEHEPKVLVDNARRAEEAGFTFALVSDHFHPWTDEQGQSPFVWSVIGAIAHATERLRLGTGVTCPTIRIHPAIIAQAAATTAAMMPGRFFLGVGTGENLNEHILGDPWPSPDERLDMLDEAIDVLRTLWEGGYQTFRGEYFTVEQARLYTLPESPPPIVVAAAKPNAAELAGRSGDGLVSTAPEAEVVQRYRDAGGDGPRYAQITVSWASSQEEAVATAHRVWPNSALKGDLTQELALPLHFEQAVATVRPDDIAEAIVCGPDPEPYVEATREYVDAGFDHVYFHQVGRDQNGFFGFWEAQLADAVRPL